MEKFTKGEFVGLHEGEMFVVGNGKTDGADAGIEVEDVIGFDVAADFLEGEFVDWEVDLEEAVGRIAIGVVEDGVFERGEIGVRLVIFVESARNFAVLATTEKERLIATGFDVSGIEVGDDFLGGLENFGALERGFLDGDFAMRTSGMESEVDFLGVMIPIERIFHFIAVKIVMVVGDDCGRGKGDFVFTKNFLDE